MDTPPPQGFTEYPRPLGTPSGVRPLPPGAHIEAISEAFTLFQKDWATWVVATLIGAICFGVVYVLGVVYLALTGMGGSKAELSESQIVFLILFYIVLGAVQLSFQFGLISMALKKLHGNPIQIGDVFGAIRFLPRLIGATLCMGVITVACCIALIIPGLWAAGAFAFAPYLILDQDRGVIDSLQTSYRAAGNFMVGLSVFAMLFLFGLVTGIGQCACFVGLLATVPIGVIAGTIQYYYFFPDGFSVPATPAPATAPG